MALGLLGFDRARHLDGSTKQQQLFREGCLACVRVGNNAESAASERFATHGR